APQDGGKPSVREECLLDDVHDRIAARRISEDIADLPINSYRNEHAEHQPIGDDAKSEIAYRRAPTLEYLANPLGISRFRQRLARGKARIDELLIGLIDEDEMAARLGG